MCKELNCLCPSDDCHCESCRESATICCECGDECSGDYRIRESNIYCPDCDPKVECFACKKLVDKDEAYEYDGETYCSECMCSCDKCGDSFPSGDAVSARSSHNRAWNELCPDCAADTFECECCGNTIIGEPVSADDGDTTVCVRCADNHYQWCDRCDTLHHVDHDHFCSPEERSHSTQPNIGEKTSRFTLRTVGVEIETGSGATDPDFAGAFDYKFRPWGYKGDGSLDYGAMELVSPPLGGDKIATELKGVYRLLRDHGVDMRDDCAGCHIHVDYSDIRSRLIAADMKGDELPGDIFVQWGESLTTITRLLVSVGRAHSNKYCSEGFGTRNDYEVNYAVRKKLAETGYAAVAVRSRTIEFRIWEVTGSAEVTMARAEFSQKSVDFLSRMLSQPTKRDTARILKRFNKAVANFKVGHFTQIKRLFGLSEECVKEMQGIFSQRISETFNEIHYRRYAFY